MSLVLNDTATKRGIVQMYEKELGFEYGEVSGNSDKLLELVAQVNLALDDFTQLALKSAGRWEFDDSNFSDYPILTATLVAGQRDYPLTSDGDGNLALEIKKVLIAGSNGIFTEMTPIDPEAEPGTDGFWNGQNTTGTPCRYGKLGNGIFLDPIPSYGLTGGLKAYVNREASYFTAADITKKPGVPGIFHRYFVIVPAYRYAARNSMPQAGGRLRNGAFTGLLMEINNMEDDIQAYFARRDQDTRKRLTAGAQDNR